VLPDHRSPCRSRRLSSATEL